MTKWEQLEEYLFERELMGEAFNSVALSADLQISRGCYGDDPGLPTSAATGQ